jgi:hypothetical protein
MKIEKLRKNEIMLIVNKMENGKPIMIIERFQKLSNMKDEKPANLKPNIMIKNEKKQIIVAGMIFNHYN